MKIGELSQRTGLSIHTLRFYESVGVFGANQVARNSNGYRHYHEDAVERLRVVGAAQRAGFTLHEITELLPQKASGGFVHRREVLEEKLHQIEERLLELRVLRDILREKLGRTPNKDFT